MVLQFAGLGEKGRKMFLGRGDGKMGFQLGLWAFRRRVQEVLGYKD